MNINEAVQRAEAILAELKAERAKQQAVKKGRWKPEYHQAYFFILPDGRISNFTWCHDDADKNRFAASNVFKTKEAAEARAKWLKLHTALADRAAESWKEEVDWKLPAQEKWEISWDGDEDFYVAEIGSKSVSGIFSSRQSALEAARDILGNDAKFYLTYDWARNW